MPRGHTLPEMLIVLTIAALLLAVALPRSGRIIDGIVARQAADRVAVAHARARSIALAAQRVARLVVTPESLTVWSGDSLRWSATGPASIGVTVESGGGETAYAPNGQAMGAANTRYVLRRGSVGMEVLVSRLGRVRSLRLAE